MKVQELKKFAKKHKSIIFAIRVVVIYFILMLIAKHIKVVYEMGVLSDTILSIVIIAAIYFYRFLSYAVVPAIFVLFFMQLMEKGWERTKKYYE